MTDDKLRQNEHWRDKLNREEYKICRLKGTEPAFSGEYWNHWEKGKYFCKCCNQELFSSSRKFDAGCGWPSFDKPLDDELIVETMDHSLSRERVEITCKKCESHLGHVFTDGPTESGLRYCVNSASITHKDIN